MEKTKDHKYQLIKHRTKTRQTRDERRLTLKIEAPLAVDVVVRVIVDEIVAVDAPFLAAPQLARGNVFRAPAAAVGSHVPLPGHGRHADGTCFFTRRRMNRRRHL